MPVWAYGPCFKSYLSNKFDRPERILDQAEMNLAAHGVRRLSGNYFESGTVYLICDTSTIM